MKLKVKWDGQRQVVDLGERGVNEITLGELKQIVLMHFHSDAKELRLSLNKQDVLEGEDQVLSSFGLVSGDLVHVIGTPHPSIGSASGSASLHSGSDSSSQTAFQTVNTVFSGLSQTSFTGGPSNDHLISGESSQCEEYASPEASLMHELVESDTAAKESLHSESKSDINRYLMEPLVLRESNEFQVPAVLNQLYSCADCGGATDALWVAVHCLMLESGFSLQTSSDDCMPNDWRRTGYYRCEYNYRLSAGVTGQCSVTGVTLGNTVAVHGVAASKFNTETLHLSAPQFVRGLNTNIPAVYRCLDRLSLVVKDKICLPLANDISTSAGFREEQGLLSLPHEVLLRMICCLDVQSIGRLGQANQELNSACSDKTIWRRLYLQHFPTPTDKSLGQDWFQLYKQASLRRKLREESDRMLHRSFWDRHVFEPQRPFGPIPRPPFPYMLGGESDLNPEFVSGIPNPMGRTLRTLQGHDPTSRNRRNQAFSSPRNLTGSPFFRNSFF